MIEIKSKIKRWGNSSLAFIIPKEIVIGKKLKANQEIKVLLEEDSNVLKETFGILKGKLTKSTGDLMNEIDSDLWGE